MMKRRPYESLSNQLRQIIKDDPRSRYALCQAASLDPSQMHRFLHGTGRLTTDSLDRLGEVLGLRFVVVDE